MKNKIIKKLAILTIGGIIYCGIPYCFGTWLFLVSWLPAILACVYLGTDF